MIPASHPTRPGWVGLSFEDLARMGSSRIGIIRARAPTLVPAIEAGELDVEAVHRAVVPAARSRRRECTMVNKRRGRRDMCAIRQAILEVLVDERPATARSVFYRLVSRGAVAKTEREYKGTVIRLLSSMRLDGVLPWGWITDGTRLRLKPRTYRGLAEYLAISRQAYRRALWADADVHVQVWAEKDAIVGVLHPVTAEWDVQLFPCRGYPSLTYLHEAAEEIAELGKPTHVYYFGDRDPSGVDIDRNVERRLREFAPDAEIEFTRVAVLPEQIEALDLPTRPTKRTDSRSRGFRGESVEVDAIPPSELRRLALACIHRHVDLDELRALGETERLERETFDVFARQLAAGGGS